METSIDGHYYMTAQCKIHNFPPQPVGLPELLKQRAFQRVDGLVEGPRRFLEMAAQWCILFGEPVFAFKLFFAVSVGNDANEKDKHVCFNRLFGTEARSFHIVYSLSDGPRAGVGLCSTRAAGADREAVSASGPGLRVVAKTLQVAGGQTCGNKSDLRRCPRQPSGSRDSRSRLSRH